ncbi:MAG: N-acetyl-gamma-glutamyl-phosphate reductase [Candidatus Tokpelaia hoelldobleri]|uniref:N-acetyl-gamma-glutamyl-phosphate reductase n=1 Tax=Candidatus Tokpelaia hoelldobleri TaxID=1902579 RepID=A0A1U9JUC5_9HYPH|nr:MAG: N-acetyl-gamma-glutamyl-phosphate reductase [Candidatus Tokpelaia hoelldoblerii]
MAKIFIDGEHGTTGLQIRARLGQRNDIELLSLPEAERRNQTLRADYLRAADIAILCLPDEAARAAVKLAQGAPTRIIDSSTAHRIAPDWVYGFGELTKGQKNRIASAQYVANPGCYPTGALALVRPLREAGLLPQDYPVSVHAVSGYTGGGKQLIAQMENSTQEDAIHASHFLYGLSLNHKHVPEITTHGLLAHKPVFTPAVGRFAQGMIVCVPLYLRLLAPKASLHSIHQTLAEHYEGQDIVTLATLEETAGTPRIDAEDYAGSDRMKLYVTGNADAGLVNLVAVLDNLGKGASGAAVQNLDLMLGL